MFRDETFIVFRLHAYPRPKQRKRVESNSPRALRIPRLSREYLKLHEAGTSLGAQGLRLHASKGHGFKFPLVG